jgi:predicted dithiol-disulfide oxidoreductase (DUF899 family)
LDFEKAITEREEEKMKKQDFIEALKENFSEGLALMIKKNSDYANPKDSFANFKRSELVGVPVERGILVRIMDKISRIHNVLDATPEVKDESLEQTVIDTMNYFNILLTYIQQKEASNELAGK